MPLKIELFEDEFIDRICRESIDDLNKFYEIDWAHHLPVPIVVKDRKSIDILKGEKTEPWLVGWAHGNKIYILDRSNFEKESSHKYSSDTYYSLLKHEISHAFFGVLSKGNTKPVWFCEGVAIYTSGQNKEKNPIDSFKEFLGFYEDGGERVYSESGFAVHVLIEEYGKRKLLDLIKGLKSVNSPEEFSGLFVTIYGMEPTYEEFNKLLGKHLLK